MAKVEPWSCKTPGCNSGQRKEGRGLCHRCYGRERARHYRENSDFREKIKTRARERYRNPAVKAKASVDSRRRLYGVTPEQLSALIKEQDGVCAICRRASPGGKGTWHVDHCHETKVVRGVLCHYCNVSLGLLGDSVVRLLDVLPNLISYLKRAFEKGSK